MKPKNFSWSDFKSYPAFDLILKTFLMSRRSFLTSHHQEIDIEAGLKEIESVFVDNFDKGDREYKDKLADQFLEASENSKLVFIHAEYLWSMPVKTIGSERIRSYALRWFTEDQVKNDESIYFDGDHDSIANPGPYYNRNKYYELKETLKILGHIIENNKVMELDSLKQAIETYCYDRLHHDPPAKYLSVHAAYLHLSNPDKYEPIISKGHRELIPKVFEHIIPKDEVSSCPEEYLKQIKESLYEVHGEAVEEFWKYRWFFYCDDVKVKWAGNKIRSTSKKALKIASIEDEIEREQNYHDISAKEGEKIEIKGYRVYRDQKIVTAAKKRDNYTCQACGFSFKQEIVHVHHLDPIGERKEPTETKLEDLITLCPNCHCIAHYFLRDPKRGSTYKEKDTLIAKLKKLQLKSD